MTEYELEAALARAAQVLKAGQDELQRAGVPPRVIARDCREAATRLICGARPSRP